MQPETPTTNTILESFTLRTQDSFLLTPETVAPGQKEIMECILNRQAPDGKRKVHVMAHTRYGKSIIIGAAVVIRAAIKKERWVIVAPTKPQAQIIMDYVLFFAMNDPIISNLLTTSVSTLKAEHLTQRRRRDHITFRDGGEIRTFGDNQTMGFGAPNIIFDEAGLSDDAAEAKVFRMLGDNPHDYFIMKIGNPFHNNHFKKAYLDSTYYKINIDAHRGMKEGRITQDILDEQRSKPNFGVLYYNLFPDQESYDKYGYLPLLSHEQIERAQVDRDTISPFGERLTGVDPNDSGQNEGVIASRWANVAQIDVARTGLDPISIASEAALIPAQRYYVDKQGVGAGTAAIMDKSPEHRSKLVKINAGEPVTADDKLPAGDDYRRYMNQRSYIYWQLKLWIEGGGKLIKDPRWSLQLGAIRYKTSQNGSIQIIPKDLLRNEYYNVHDLGAADALSFTFSPRKPKIMTAPNTVVGGVKPLSTGIG